MFLATLGYYLELYDCSIDLSMAQFIAIMQSSCVNPIAPDDNGILFKNAHISGNPPLPIMAILAIVGYGKIIVLDSVIEDINPGSLFLYSLSDSTCGPNYNNSLIFVNNTMTTAWVPTYGVSNTFSLMISP